MNIGLKTFLKYSGRKLPYDAEVEYLESTGTQWIDTGMKSDSAMSSFDVSIRLRFTQDQRTGWKGSLYTTDGDKQFFYALNASSSTGLYMAFNGTKNIIRNLSAKKTTWHVVRAFVQDRYVAYIFDGVEVGRFAFTPLSFPAMYLFACSGNTGDIADRSMGMQAIARFSMDINGSLVRDMIPVRFTNEAGQSEGAMYDRVSGQLFRNSGTGAFVIGPDKSAANGGISANA